MIFFYWSDLIVHFELCHGTSNPNSAPTCRTRLSIVADHALLVAGLRMGGKLYHSM